MDHFGINNPLLPHVGSKRVSVKNKIRKRKKKIHIFIFNIFLLFLYFEISTPPKYKDRELLHNNNNLSNSDVTINDLKQAGLTFIKEPKYTMIEIEEDNEYCYRTILSSNIVELKTSQVIYGEDYMNFDLYLIPQKEGTDLLEIQFFNMKTKELVQNEIYKIMVDKNLNVVYEKVEM